MSFWETAYAEHGPVVLAFLGRRLPSRADAEDLLQETFVRAMRVGNQHAEGLRYYLLTTAQHLLINRSRRPRLVLRAADLPAAGGGGETDGEAAAPSDPIETAADGAASPERNAAWSAFHAELARAVEALPPDQRRAFRLGVVERHPYADIVRLTGWSLAAVKTNVFRARQRVLAALGDRLEDAMWSLGS